MHGARGLWLFVASLVTALSLATASAGTAKAPAHLPRAKPGLILPSAGGVVLGRTTKAELFATWGRPSYCWTDPGGCVWGARANARPGADVGPDEIHAMVVPRGGFVHYLGFSSRNWETSKLRGWRTREGIRIGSSYQALKRAYAKLHWDRGETDNPNRSNWAVEEYRHDGNRFWLRFLVDRSISAINSGHVIRIEVGYRGGAFVCKLAARTTPGPEGEVTGTRIQGSCSGTHRSWYAGPGGSQNPLYLSFAPLNGAVITSIASPFDRTCNGRLCKAGGDWAVDVTVGFESERAGVKVTAHEPAGYASGSRAQKFHATFP